MGVQGVGKFGIGLAFGYVVAVEISKKSLAVTSQLQSMYALQEQPTA